MISVKVLADSVSHHGKRITTFELTYPRVIHAEFMTHRMFSRNASSSRAIPWKRMREWVMTTPYIPIHWGKNQSGMQATEELTHDQQADALEAWLKARDLAVAQADILVGLGIHKQLANRLVEPFGHINVVATSTNFENFFALRIHKAAMPEIQALAVAMGRAMSASDPVMRPAGKMNVWAWHLPYVTDEERTTIDPSLLPRISAARCARVSYKTHEGQTPSLDEDLSLFIRLVGSAPVHASPTEHQAFPAAEGIQSGNLVGWVQHRKLIAGECASPDFEWRSRLIEYEGVDYIV